MDRRPPKRARQACDTCRRKKTRCPGEKPICSFCARLEQSCSYSDEQSNPERHSGSDERESREASNVSALENRFEKLEEKVDLVFSQILLALSQQGHSLPSSHSTVLGVNHAPISSSLETSSLSDASPAHCNRQIALAPVHEAQTSVRMTSPVSSSWSFSAHEERGNLQLLPLAVQSGVIKLYMSKCDCQPLSIFDVNDLEQNFDSYSLEVRYLVLAVALRFSHDTFLQDQHQQVAMEFLERARRMIFQNVMDGIADISTLQALCLCVFLDLSAGHSQRAWVNIGIGTRLSQSSQFLAPVNRMSESQIEEWRRLYWTLYLLRCLAGDTSEPARLTISNSPSFPMSLDLKLKYGVSIQPSIATSPSTGDIEDIGIIGYSLQLVELWQTALDYVTAEVPISEPAWAPNSGQFQIVKHIMEWESYLCRNHRYAHVRFAEQQSADLQTNSRYWGPWLFVQFTYHSTLCLLHHPFYLYKITEGVSTTASMSFLERCSDQALLHAKHISRLIDALEQKKHHTSDPFLGYCATIAATTHLWYCYVEDRGVKEQARSRFTTCYKFVLRLAKLWPVAERMATNLATANIRASTWSAQTEAPFSPCQIPISDTILMWDLLKYCLDISPDNAARNDLQSSTNRENILLRPTGIESDRLVPDSLISNTSISSGLDTRISNQNGMVPWNQADDHISHWEPISILFGEEGAQGRYDNEFYESTEFDSGEWAQIGML